MFKKTLIFLIVLSLGYSCSNQAKNEKEILIESIANLEKESFNSISNSYDDKMALKTIVEYQKFIEKYPKDSLSEIYLYSSAQLSKSINLYGEALRKYQKFANDYPESKNAAKAQFMIGMIYENDIKDTVKAKEAYQTFIKKFPNNDLVDDAQFLIQNLSLTDDELIKMLEAKSKENQDPKDSII